MKSNLVFKNILNFPFLEELMDETGPPEADNELAVDVQDKYFKFESPAPDQMGTKKQIAVKSDKNSPNIFRFGSAPPKVKISFIGIALFSKKIREIIFLNFFKPHFFYLFKDRKYF